MEKEEVKGLTFAFCSLVYSMCGCPLNHLWTFWAWHLLLTPFMSQSQKTENVLFRGITMKKKKKTLPTNQSFLGNVSCHIWVYGNWIDETSFSLLFVHVNNKKRVCVRIGFLFSVWLIAAVYPFMSNCQCMHPLPSQSQVPTVKLAACAWRQPWACVSRFPVYFSQLKLISRCALLYKKNPLSLFLSRSLSSCVRCIHPSRTHYDCLSFSLMVCPFPTLTEIPRSIYSVKADVHLATCPSYPFALCLTLLIVFS